MAELPGTTIRNPLTIIAIFAGIAEISGTIVLPFIHERNQDTFVWFLMAFPSALIAMFFATLNWNHKVLYAPSDYKDEGNFVKTLPAATLVERVEKLVEEAARTRDPDVPAPTGGDTAHMTGTVDSLPLRIARVEEVVFGLLSSEYGKITRGIKLGDFVADGVARNAVSGALVVFELLYAVDGKMPKMAALKRVASRAFSAARSLRQELELVLIVVADADEASTKRFQTEAKEAFNRAPFDVTTRVYWRKDIDPLLLTA